MIKALKMEVNFLTPFILRKSSLGGEKKGMSSAAPGVDALASTQYTGSALMPIALVTFLEGCHGLYRLYLGYT
jgi:hypothetical protein